MLERRYIAVPALRADPGVDGAKSTLGGYAATFGDLSVDLGGFREIIAPGAFRDSLASGADIRALYNHDSSNLLGRTSNKTLTVVEDDRGLNVTCELPDTSYARDLMALVRRGDICGMSFGFNVPDKGDSWGKAGGGLVRTLNRIDLSEVSFVGNPAYTSTSVSSRALGEVRSISENSAAAIHRLAMIRRLIAL